MRLLRLRDAVDKVIREEQCSFRKGRGRVDQVLTLRLIIEKYLRCQTTLILSFIDYEQAFGVCYVLFVRFCFCVMYENNTAAVMVGNEVSSWVCIKSGVKQGSVPSPFI